MIVSSRRLSSRKLLLALLAAPAAAVVLMAAAQIPRNTEPPKQTIKLNPMGPGRVFDGVGAISSSSSLLLYDYPEPQRSQILDYLFKPNYGASLNIFKFEIGSDANSTAAAEPSHMRTPDEINCHRGIEWWMAKQAKARHPNIKLYALMWGAPGWFKGGLWGPDHVHYLTTWLGCAKENGLHIDYLGGGNERSDPPPPVSFYVALHKAIAKDYPDTEIIASDEHDPPNYWHIATEMLADKDAQNAISILGEHDVCHWRSLYQHCDVSHDARFSGKPLWNSEQSTQDAAAGAEPLARAMNRNYIEASLTGNINWAIVAGFYDNTGTGGQGLIVAETPWSGDYTVSKSVWVDAHTTHFVQPGWRYLDLASTYMTNGASYVTLYSPQTGDYTIVIESADATTGETIRFVPNAKLSQGPVSLWTTDLASPKPADWFVHQGDEPAGKAGITLTVKPHHLYTLTTVTAQQSDPAAHVTPVIPDTYLPLPFHEDFDHVDSTHRARFFQDQAGAFEAAPCASGRPGTCYSQVIRQQPVLWHNGGRAPSTLFGDPNWWGDYTLQADALLQESGYIELLGRIEQYNQNVIAGYHLRLADDGAWRLYTEDTGDKKNSLGFESTSQQTTLASGTAAFAINQWHHVSLRFQGEHIAATLDGHPLFAITGDTHSTGQAGLAVSPWKLAQFDNVSVEKSAPWPTFVPLAHIRATATSSQPGTYEHRIYVPSEAINGRIESRWSSQLNPALPMPQSITLDLGATYATTGLAYTPPGDTGRGGRITRYAIQVSKDGKLFHQVAQGTWKPTIATKTANWPVQHSTRFVRLQALDTFGPGAAASNLRIICYKCGQDVMPVAK